LDLVEIWFGSSNAKPSACGTFTSVPDLIIKVRAFITGWNTCKHPFIWTKPADEIAKSPNRKHKSSQQHTTRMQHR
jgi:hypothetical protein